jgi:hypothetical protein
MKMEAVYLPHVTRRITAAVILCVCVTLLAGGVSAQNDSGSRHQPHARGFGFDMSATATEKDLGLPFYPGSKPYKEDAESDPALHMGFSNGTSGFKFVLMRLSSADSPEKVAAYYRKAMAKYGTVLDCSKSVQDSGKTDSGKSDKKSNALTCEDDHADKGGYAYKVGSKEKQHVVAVEPNGKDTVISLIYVEAPDDKDQDKEND